ncbi:hypothetical protein GUJ93_ZPchr0005g15603 [Zizania palustris]|uniref:Uncharacterized protein n=1 Tax=Zizania palustris TaxID=103762 RepID=A0A8J5T4A2_ZIZPA|nr:hypothetical protein GUJ93_ZPchr0005g15603 [Zizania palustris]
MLFFLQSWQYLAMDIFRDEEEYNTNPTPSSNRLNRDLFPEVNSSVGRGQSLSSPGSAGMSGFDLNSDGIEFPNLSSYQEILRSSSTGRGLVTHIGSGGDRPLRGSREFRAPRNVSAVPRGGRGGRGAAVGRGASPPLGAISSAGRAAAGGRGANAVDSQEDSDEVFGSQVLSYVTSSDVVCSEIILVFI